MDNGEICYRRFLEGDNSAFEEILKAYHKNLIFFINSYVKNFAQAEDIAADVFAYILTYPRKYNFKSSVKTYLFMLGRSRAIDYLRHEKRFAAFELTGAESESGNEAALEDELIKDEQKQMLYAAIEELNGDYKTVLYLIYLEGFSYEEAAKTMKKNKKQIENLAYRAKNALREALGKEWCEQL